MHIIEYPAVPLNTPIQGGMNHNAEVKLHATTLAGPNNGFVMEFLSSEGVALHINFRMGLYGGENAIVFNSMSRGCWQQENRHHNVLGLNQYFHIHVTAHTDHFSIHCNGQHINHFTYRQSPYTIHTLVVRGDLRVEKISFDHFFNQNGGGVQIGGGAAPAVVMSSAPVVYASAPAPAVVIAAPPPRPIVEVVVPPRRPIIEVIAPPPRPLIEVVVPRRPLFGGPTVIVEKGGRHGHHHHGGRHGHH